MSGNRAKHLLSVLISMGISWALIMLLEYYYILVAGMVSEEVVESLACS